MYARDIEFVSRNAAAFVENVFQLGSKVLLIPGVRVEWLEGSASGRNNLAQDGSEIKLQNVTRSRSFLLAGAGAEYHVTHNTEFYANYTQAYRPIQFANLQAPPTTNIIDPNLSDAKGYNIDLGYRGKVKNYLQFDISGFYLQYNNRVGNVTLNSGVDSGKVMVTNVGASTSKGIESYVEFNPVRAFSQNGDWDVILFSSYAYTNARYSGNHKDANTKGKKVENAPENIFRGGISAGYKNALLTAQVSRVSETFSDANNTVAPTANAQNGLIPAYTVTDLTATYKFLRNLNVRAGINNVFDARYFTRRAGGYPGPGALPADGRTFFVSFGAKL
jgi:Fe(3+) dicitrate transport protein